MVNWFMMAASSAGCLVLGYSLYTATTLDQVLLLLLAFLFCFSLFWTSLSIVLFPYL